MLSSLRIGFVPSLRQSEINTESFPCLQEHLLSAAVIEFRGPAVGVACDSLSGFKGAIIFEKISNTGGPE
jgi:hypothetical protein